MGKQQFSALWESLWEVTVQCNRAECSTAGACSQVDAFLAVALLLNLQTPKSTRYLKAEEIKYL